ncbi:hypothetical protein BKA80DRAFT_286581 [Phyllosticta citrichinensis]
MAPVSRGRLRAECRRSNGAWLQGMQGARSISSIWRVPTFPASLNQEMEEPQGLHGRSEWSNCGRVAAEQQMHGQLSRKNEWTSCDGHKEASRQDVGSVKQPRQRPRQAGGERRGGDGEQAGGKKERKKESKQRSMG